MRQTLAIAIAVRAACSLAVSPGWSQATADKQHMELAKALEDAKVRHPMVCPRAWSNVSRLHEAHAR